MKTKFKISISLILIFIIYTIINWRLPVYSYESSDRGMAEIEVPWKGRDLEMVQTQFEKYRKWKNNPDLKLFRTCKRIWDSPNLWIDNLVNARWKIPYMNPSDSPNSQYFKVMNKDLSN